jgi:hypothetical protein
MNLQFPGSIVFVLGAQRSGTTWLANIVDSSPDTLLFMEPFSRLNGVFPEFPATSVCMRESTPALDQLLREDMPRRLMRHKYLLSPRSMVDPGRFRRERWLAQWLKRFAPPPLRRRAHQFEQLNLNRFEGKAPLVTKSRSPRVAVVKELRFALKVPVLKSAFPGARFVVIVRHPCATVHSILTWFDRGSLVELHRDLETYLDDITAQPIASSYGDELARARSGGLAHRVALYWRISYETLFSQLDGDPNAELLVYERLAAKPRETTTTIFDRSGIPYSQEVDAYLSSSSRGGRSGSGAVGPMDTRRDSARYYRAWVDSIDPATEDAVLEMTAASPLMASFEPYYQGA